MTVVPQDAATYMTTTPREVQEKLGRIRTFTGLLVAPLDMQYEDFDIRDIAHHLSNVCRYTGAVPEFYSVAQHSVLVARYFLEPDKRLAGLLHDAAEAYIADVSSPVKNSEPFAFYRHLDDEIVKRVYLSFGIDPQLLAEIKQFDDLVYQREVASFWPRADFKIAADQFIAPWSPGKSRREFLNLFWQLFPSWDGKSHGRGLLLGRRA